eukprot:Skav223019  [mRNA]  locus=scaffold1422:137330:137877:+ [translate_table: standard]
MESRLVTGWKPACHGRLEWPWSRVILLIQWLPSIEEYWDSSDARILVWDAQEVAVSSWKLCSFDFAIAKAAEGAQRVQELSARAAMEPRHLEVHFCEELSS